VATVCMTPGREISRHMKVGRVSPRTFFAASALLFAAATALTIMLGTSMSAMREMPMPGGWTLSPIWIRMAGHTWTDSAASFLGMWAAMMVMMMQPSLAPALWRFHLSVRGKGDTRVGRLAALVSIGYYFVWIVVGGVVYALGAALAAI